MNSNFANVRDKRLEYRITNQKLGQGAFSKVFVAIHLQTNTKVAMKIVQLRNIQRREEFNLSMNEVTMLKKIDSPHVLKLHDSFVTNNILYLATEFIDGVDLGVRIQIMRNRGILFSERSIWYKFHQICAGLKALHEKRILHRDTYVYVQNILDLKPSNIFITTKYQVKIGDLGLSHHFEDGTSTEDSFIGTVYYMSPERMNREEYSFPADIWSLGCLLYEICTFQSPFSGERKNLYSLKNKINNADIIPIPMNVFSEQLVYFTFACLNIESDERPTADACHDAARAMYEKFEQILADNKKSPATTCLNIL
uniref:Protein kinase domain-containing protein n=1 Tax=Panagrolaimus sp. ES5 TaxID=591445 RepID=A0AC34F3N5_9BILA